MLDTYDKNLKRKRSSSHQHQRSGYPTPSRPESYETVVRDEEQGSHQRPGQNSKQGLQVERELHREQEPRNLLFPSIAHVHDSSVLPLIESSSDLSTETAITKSSAERLIAAPNNTKEQGTEGDFELSGTEAYVTWSGRGRSPFKTPVTAAIDGLRGKAKLVRRLEQELAKEHKALEDVLRWKRYRLTGIVQTRLEVENDHIDPMKMVERLPPPDVDDHRGRSGSPDKYIRKLANSDTPIIHFLPDAYEHSFPINVERTLGSLEDKLGEGCIPLQFKVFY